MQIGNNRTNGPQPHDRNNAKLDPDLTKVNREGIEKTTRDSGEKTQRAIDERSPANTAESLKSRDTFQRSRPQDDAAPSVEERIKNARMQGKEAKADRIENARGQRAGRIGNARIQNTEARQATRISGARDKQAKATDGARVENARSQRADRIDNARVQDTEARQATRISGARDKHAKATDAARIENSRTPAASPERIENARNQRADRIENARSQHTRVENSLGTNEVSSLSRESVQFSGSVEALASSELPGAGGTQESSEIRAAYVAELRKAFQAGELNSPERLRNAAARLLGGE